MAPCLATVAYAQQISTCVARWHQLVNRLNMTSSSPHPSSSRHHPQAAPNPRISVLPERARVPPESSVEVEVSIVAEAQGPWAAVLELEVRGGKPLKVPIRCGACAVSPGPLW